jgi:hypothetical protein
MSPKVIRANDGKLFAIACSGMISVGGNKQDGYEVSFEDEKGQSHDWRGLHDIQIDDESELTKSCPGQTTSHPEGGPRELNDTEIDNLRKRNECEARFWNKKIAEVDGMSVGAACKQNPDRMPN